MRVSNLFAGAAMALGLFAVSTQGAAAATFADFSPTDSSANISLTGLTLAASAPVVFDFLESPALAAFGDLQADWTVGATETGAVAFGPLALGTFDGSFSFIYSGPSQTLGAVTLTAGDNLLSGTFLGSVFTGYGSSASLVDSVLGGGLVSYTSDFLSFDPSSDQGLSWAFTSVSPPVQVVGGQLTDFTGVASGNFAAELVEAGTTGGGVPEPATWAMLLLGFGMIGGGMRVARREAALAA